MALYQPSRNSEMSGVGVGGTGVGVGVTTGVRGTVGASVGVGVGVDATGVGVSPERSSEPGRPVQAQRISARQRASADRVSVFIFRAVVFIKYSLKCFRFSPGLSQKLPGMFPVQSRSFTKGVGQ